MTATGAPAVSIQRAYGVLAALSFMGFLMVTILGLMVVYTYTMPFLTEVSGFAESTMPALLTASGIAGMGVAIYSSMYNAGIALGSAPGGRAAGVVLPCAAADGGRRVHRLGPRPAGRHELARPGVTSGDFARLDPRSLSTQTRGNTRFL